MLDSICTELQLLIVSYLGEPELLATRQVSRRLRSVAHSAFGTTFFSTLTTDLSKASLSRIRNIAATESLRDFVHVLQIEPWGADECRLRESYAQGARGIGKGKGKGKDRSGEVYNDDCSSSLPHEELWALRRCVVSGLPNCRSFVITDLLSFNPHPADDPSRFHPMDTVAILLSIIAGPDGPVSSDGSSVEEIDTTPLSVQSLRIRLKPPSRPDHPTVERLLAPIMQIQRILSGDRLSWTSLRTLELSFDPGTAEDEAWALAVDLITKAENLETLTLACLWDSADPLMQAVARAETLPRRLKHFTLGAVTMVSEEALLALLSRFGGDDLLSLGFYLVDLTAPSWRAVFGAVQHNFPRLESFTLHSCRQGPEGNLVFFCPLLKNMDAVFGPADAETGERAGGGQLELTDLIYRERKRRVCGIRYVTGEGGGGGMAQALDAVANAAYSLNSGGEESPGFGMAEDENGELTLFRPSKYDFWSRI